MYIITTKTIPVGRPYSVGVSFSLGRQMSNCKLTAMSLTVSFNARKNNSEQNWPLNRHNLAVAVVVLLDR